MPSGDPLWYCHECHAEMRPLMVPDPACASCRGSFVEKIENPQDDPRSFAPAADDIPDEGLAGEVPGIDTFLMTLQTLMDRGTSTRPRPRPESSANGPRFSFQINRGNGAASVAFGGPSTLNAHPPRDPRVPTMSDFLGGRPPGGADREATISNQMMAQYLLALLGDRDPLAALLGGVAGGPGGTPLENGRMGDYVFSQEALDQIITQLMENSNAHRPVPATDDLVEKLPREVLTADSVLLNEDCAVCKDQFSLATENPDELVTIRLPCKHPFHEPCILPWLKTSGTCPVCRYALVPQPSQPSSPPPTSSGSTSSAANRSPSRRDSGSGGGILQHIFGHFTGGNPPSSGSPHGSPSTSPGPSTSSGPPRHRRSSSDNSGGGRHSSNRDHLPGSWEDDLD